jgi:hypothetical protein
MNVGITIPMRRKTNRNMVRPFILQEEKRDRRRGAVPLSPENVLALPGMPERAYRIAVTSG